ncbi:hypothetical protein [Evansella halocellulosilytica]|uniref:hypothetical protein n=1 Tax=Evansella halocellulosilytica TaxID=2011013 RepID=UPI000BB8A563|nr:hypothetical protein [Evansella halocellulosilytica]
MTQFTLKKEDWTSTWTSAAAAIHGAVKYTEKKDLNLVDVMGLTGHAFRINIDLKEINVAGPTAMPGGYIVRRNLCNLGFTSNLADGEAPITPEILEQTIELIQESVDRGIPAIVFDMFIPEFGLIYGYDDNKKVFYAKDTSRDGEVTYEDFADVRGVLYASTISESLPHSKYEMLRMALDMIIDHARGREWQHIFEGKFVTGLNAYDIWIDVLEKRGADPNGNAYNAQVVSDAREFAAKFLYELTVKWDGTNVVERGVRKFAGLAAKHYADVAKALIEFREMFPFPHGGEPANREQADRAIQLLKKAKEAEEQGVEQLEVLHGFMKAYYCEKWIH